MKIRYVILLILVLIITFFQTQRQREEFDQVCFKAQCFRVEVARTEDQWQKGLMYRNELAKNNGMLFIFNKMSKHNFWMKNTYIPLDMIWLDYSRRVIHIEENVQPCQKEPCPTYGPQENALYVFEINAMEAKNANVRVGDLANFKLITKTGDNNE